MGRFLAHVLCRGLEVIVTCLTVYVAARFSGTFPSH